MRRIQESTSAVLLQSDLDENWGTDSMEYYTYLRNIQDLLSDDKIPYERCFGKSLKTSTIRLNHCLSITLSVRKISQEYNQFGKKVIFRLFLEYALCAGELWKENIVIADMEELETMNASEIYSKRFNAKRRYFSKIMENLFFQSQMDESNSLQEIKNGKHPS